MDINDGGAAAAEFASEHDSEESDSDTQSEISDSDHENDETERNSMNSASEGEITAHESEDENDKIDRGNQDTSPQRKWKKSQGDGRRSSMKKMENKLNTLSDALFAMKEMFMRSGMAAEGKTSGNEQPNLMSSEVDNDQQMSRGNEGPSIVSHSETTVYRNALNKVAENEVQMVQVDPEIIFKQKRDSSSSEERNDTSDEMLEMETEFTEQYIAGETSDDKGRKRSYPMEDQLQDTPRQLADAKIREAEAIKARILATPGNSASVDDNYIVVGVHIDQTICD